MSKVCILDYGSGFNPDLILLLSKKLSDNNFNYHITCVDFYSKENLNELNKNYKQINFVDFKDISDVLIFQKIFLFPDKQANKPPKKFESSGNDTMGQGIDISGF